jgi:nitroreductase
VELTAAMRSMGSIRELTDETVPREVLYRILDSARFSGSGGNRQGWHVTVIESPEVRAEIMRCSRLGFLEYAAQVAEGLVPFSPGDDGRWHGPPVDLDAARTHELHNPFMDVLENASVLLLVSVDLRTLAITDIDADHVSIVGGASIYPFVQNILLAARDEDLGGVLTTFVCRAEAEVRELVGLPPSHTIAALLVLGHPHKHPTKLKRNPVEAFATIDRYDGEPLGSPKR